MKNREIGNHGERIAAKFFLDKGWKFVDNNYYEKNFGEIDLIFRDEKNQLVFIEVKTRTNEKFGEGFEAVEEKKLRKMAKTGELFCLKNGIDFDKVRFDVVSILVKVEGGGFGERCKIRHFEKVL